MSIKLIIGEYIKGGNNNPTHRAEVDMGILKNLSRDMKIEIKESNSFYVRYPLSNLLSDVKAKYPNMSVYVGSHSKYYSIDEFCKENLDCIMDLLYEFEKFKYYEGIIETILTDNYQKIGLLDRYAIACNTVVIHGYTTVLMHSPQNEKDEFAKALFANDVLIKCIDSNYNVIGKILEYKTNPLHSYIKEKYTEHYENQFKNKDILKAVSISCSEAYDLLNQGFRFDSEIAEGVNKLRVYSMYKYFYSRRDFINNLEFDGDYTENIKFLIDLELKNVDKTNKYLKDETLLDLISLKEDKRIEFDLDQVFKYFLSNLKNDERDGKLFTNVIIYLTRIPYERKYNKLYKKLFNFDVETYNSATSLGKSLYFNAKIVNVRNSGVQLKNFIHFYLGCLSGITKQDFEKDYDIFIEILGLIMNNDLKVFYSLLLGDTQIEYMIPRYMQERIADGLFQTILPEMKKVRIRAILKKIFVSTNSRVFSINLLEQKLKENAKHDIRYKQIMMELKMKK